MRTVLLAVATAACLLAGCDKNTPPDPAGFEADLVGMNYPNLGDDPGLLAQTACASTAADLAKVLVVSADMAATIKQSASEHGLCS